MMKDVKQWFVMHEYDDPVEYNQRELQIGDDGRGALWLRWTGFGDQRFAVPTEAVPALIAYLQGIQKCREDAEGGL